MPKFHSSNTRTWIYLIAVLAVVPYLVRYSLRLIAQFRGSGDPSTFAQVFSGLMIGFVVLILYGYWTEYWTDVSRGQASSRPQFSLGCLVILVFASGFAFGLLALAWKMFQRIS